MVIIQGIALLLLILSLFTLFSYKAPFGMKAMGALAGSCHRQFPRRGVQCIRDWRTLTASLI